MKAALRRVEMRPPRSVDESEPNTPRLAQTFALDTHPHTPGRSPVTSLEVV